MTWNDLEKAFNRALVLSLSWKRLILTFSALMLCGIFVVFCQALAQTATPWIRLCFGFLPLFLSFGVLLALGVILTKISIAETKRIAVNVRRLLHSSMDLLIGISYLALPSLLIFLVLWIVLGIFFLLKEIPGVGEFFSAILSFGPFLIIFATLLLVIVNLGLLFFVAPAATLLSIRKGSLLRIVIKRLEKQILRASALFLLGALPLGILFSLLYFSAVLTSTSFFCSAHCLLIAMQWFFMMIPFSALMTPAVVFFFNFSAESYLLLGQE
jgi:hypothetical protein